ncbi:MAG: choice-of-anchor D domain-containing protein, partial [Ignavibacteriota bacterium]
MNQLSARLSFAIFLALFFGAMTGSGVAQWRIATPRDTVAVPANQSTFVTSKIFITGGGVDMWVSPSGIFTENDGSTTFGMDAAYTDLINGNVLVPQAQNPPNYAGKVHKYSFTVTTIPGLNETNFISLENAYQANHVYTARYASQGNKFQFRISGEKITDYPRATGSLNVKMARWTAGIAIKDVNLDFGNVLIGSSGQILDSLASYGLDPLLIDSIKIIDTAAASDFSFLSERNNRFTLPTEQTNQLKITFSPSRRGAITAELHVYSHNADPVSRDIKINLYGFGIAPDFGVGPQQIDFGKVRIGYPRTGFTQISNAKGNATLTINTNTSYQQYLPIPPPIAFSFAAQTVPPIDITPGSIGQIRTLFNPTARFKYQGVLRVRANNVPVDSVTLIGEGAEPIPVLTPAKNTALDFGIVYNGNTNTQIVTLKNAGNWTTSVILARISGQFKSMFSFTPGDTVFNVEPDSSRNFNITFHPGAPSDSLHILCFFELVYDDNTIDTIRLTGIEIQPEVLISPLTHNFGKVKIGAIKQDTVCYVRTSAKANSSVRLLEDVRPGVHFKEVGKIGTISPGVDAPFVCTFKPLQAGPLIAWAYITANDKHDSVQLTGIGAVAKAIVNPSPLNYGIVPSNRSDTLTATLRDSGDYPLQVDSISVTGPSAKDFTIMWKPNGKTPVPPFAIEADSTIEIQVRFITNDLTGAVHQASLCIYYNDGTSDCIPIQAIEEAQFLQFAQSSLDFGKRRVKTHTVAPAVFRNGSNKTLSAAAVTATSASNAFTVTDTLPAVKSQSRDSINVDFFPQTRGFYTGYLHAFGGDIKTDSIQLRGQGAAPLPQFSDTVVDFGIVLLGVTQSSSFELLDTGDWFLRAVKIEKIADKYNEFSYRKGPIVSIASDSIGENDYASYQVSFTPS